MSKSAEGAKKYYSEEYYKEGQSAQLNYYSEESLSIGTWGGKAAQELGLTGAIARQDFARLCDNLHPVSGKTLTGRQDKDRTVGYDLTFNASKSVSLAYTFGDDADKKIILDAFKAAVSQTMQDVERGMQARVRCNGANENRITGNIAYGNFIHFTTRPIDGLPDPHLHSHCFVFNATYDAKDKKWKAGQFRQIKQDAPYYEAIFHSRLAHNLQQAGYAIERTKHGFELAGIDRLTLEKFSWRTQEIEEYSRAHDITDAKQKSQIGAKTREAKRAAVSIEQQSQEWRSRLNDSEQRSFSNLKHQTSLSIDAKAAEQALAFSLSHHLERKSVISDKEILATAIRQAIGKTTPEQVQAAFDKDSNILSATEQLRTYITTKQALQEERQLIQHCAVLRNVYRPIHATYEPQDQRLNDQ